MADVKTVALVLRGPAWRDELTIREQSELGGHLTDADPETARRVLEDDPARAAGTIAYEVLPWYR